MRKVDLVDAKTLAADVEGIEEMGAPSSCVVASDGGFLVALDGEDDGGALHSEAGAHQQLDGGEFLLQSTEFDFFGGAQGSGLPEFSAEIHGGEGFGGHSRFRDHVVAVGAGEETEESLAAIEDVAAEARIEEEAAIDEIHEVSGGTGISSLAIRRETAEWEQPAVVKFLIRREIEREGSVGTGAVVDLVLFGADVFPFVRDVISDGEDRAGFGSGGNIGNEDPSRSRGGGVSVSISDGGVGLNDRRKCRQKCIWSKWNVVRVDPDDEAEFDEVLANRTGASVLAVTTDGTIEVKGEIGEGVVGCIDDVLGRVDGCVADVRGRQRAERLARRHLLSEMR